MSTGRLGSRLTDAVQELRELGLEGSSYRVRRELSMRSGWTRRRFKAVSRSLDIAREVEAAGPSAWQWTDRIRFSDPLALVDRLRPVVGDTRIEELTATASEAANGRVLCFGRWIGDYGSPVDWYLNPKTGKRWRTDVHWSQALREEPRVGDVKLTWEIARFPHAYHLARAASFAPEHREGFFAAFGT